MVPPRSDERQRRPVTRFTARLLVLGNRALGNLRAAYLSYDPTGDEHRWAALRRRPSAWRIHEAVDR